MYEIRFKNNNDVIESSNRKITFNENQASILTFKLLPNSPYFQRLERFVTRIEVWENSSTKVFDGRVIDIKDSMSTEGVFSYEVICESILNFLNDTRVGKWSIHPDAKPPDETPPPGEEIKEDFIIYEHMDVIKFLTLILQTHNSKVKDDKKIYLGNVTVEDRIYCHTNRESCLNIICEKLIKRKGGFLVLREEGNKYYLDYLKAINNRENTIELTINMKSINRSNNLKNIVTRLIPIGAEEITIKNVNNGIEYIEDSNLVAKYGVIEAVHSWQDVTMPENLLIKAKEKLKEINKNTYALDVSALDISSINIDFEKIKLSQECNIKNPILNINEKHRIISLDLNLDQPWNVSIKLSNNPPSAVNNSTNIVQEINNTRIELLVTDKKIAYKVSSGEFESYKEQVAEGFKQTVKKGAEFESELLQSADKFQISMNGKLGGKTYTFDGNSFKLGGTDSGNTVEHTNNHSKWIHESGHYSIAKANGFFRNNGAGEREVKSCDYLVIRPQIRNGQTVSIVLPEDFHNKDINTDFKIMTINGDIDSDVGARFKKDALRNIFVKVVSWNKGTRELIVQPCLQKIGIATQTHFGWNEATTTPGNPIGEGAIDVIVLAQI